MSKWNSEERTERICVTFMLLMKTANPGESSDKVRLVYSHMPKDQMKWLERKRVYSCSPIDKWKCCHSFRKYWGHTVCQALLRNELNRQNPVLMGLPHWWAPFLCPIITRTTRKEWEKVRGKSSWSERATADQCRKGRGPEGRRRRCSVLGKSAGWS